MSTCFSRIVNTATDTMSRKIEASYRNTLMKHHVKFIPVLIAALFGVVACVFNGHAAETGLVRKPLPDVAPLVAEIESIVMRFYPNGDVSEPNPQRIQFQANSRIFMIHTRDKIGNWQDAVSVVGPKSMGIVGAVSIHRGGWQGAAILPQQFDHFYFNEYVNAIQLRRTNAHIYVSIRFPKPYPRDFITELESILMRFSAHE